MRLHHSRSNIVYLNAFFSARQGNQTLPKDIYGRHPLVGATAIEVGLSSPCINDLNFLNLLSVLSNVPIAKDCIY